MSMPLTSTLGKESVWELAGTDLGSGMCAQVLMDPVCMLTIYPQLLQNFVYKSPRMAANVLGLVDSLRFLFSRDLLVAEVRLHHSLSVAYNSAAALQNFIGVQRRLFTLAVSYFAVILPKVCVASGVPVA